MFFSHIYTLDFTQDCNFLLSGSSDETVMIWSLEEFEVEQKALKPKPASLSLGPACDCKFFADSSSRLVAPDDTNAIQILENGVPIFSSPADSSRILCVALSNDGKLNLRHLGMDRFTQLRKK